MNLKSRLGATFAFSEMAKIARGIQSHLQFLPRPLHACTSIHRIYPVDSRNATFRAANGKVRSLSSLPKPKKHGSLRFVSGEIAETLLLLEKKLRSRGRGAVAEAQCGAARRREPVTRDREYSCGS